MQVIIAGGGLTGLSAALSLNGHDITIIDARQELGTPTRSPGFIQDTTLLEDNLPLQLQLNCNSFRRAWLEKGLATMAIEKGVKILIKTRVRGFEDGLLITGAGADPSSIIRGDVYIDALGEKSIHTGWPGNSSSLEDVEMLRPPSRKLVPWQGAITNMETEWMRADGTSEIWWKKEPPFYPKDGWLEQMSGEHPEKIGADAAILRGRELARRVC